MKKIITILTLLLCIGGCAAAMETDTDNKNIAVKDTYVTQEPMTSESRGRNEKPVIHEETVTTVGRTYVTTGINAWSRKYMNWDAEYLHEKVECGESRQLFKTMSDVEDYIEKCDLALWLGGMSVHKAEQYSVVQLRKVKTILNEDKI